MIKIDMRNLIVLLMLICCYSLHSQNLLHYAISTNGEKGDCLFPEDESGNVSFTKIVEIPYSADLIMTVADDYIMSKNASERCEIKCLSKSSRTSTYSVQMNIGKQTWGMQLFGSPLFASVRDASHIKFKCIIETRNNKYKYSLFDFETNRNTLRGEAKNDGQPNIIHWQRVNSLTKERDKYASGHNGDRRSDKEVLFDYNSQIAYEACLYQLEYDATMMFIKGLENLKFDDDDFMDSPSTGTDYDKKLNEMLQGRNVSLSGYNNLFFLLSGGEYAISSPNANVNSSNYDNFKGFLLAVGNNVYVRGGETNYEQAAVQELRKQILIDGYWNVVYDIREAHFVIDYFVDLEGRDKAHLRITTPKGDINYEPHKLIVRSSESVSTNKDIARNLYLTYIDNIAKNYMKGKIPKYLEIFNK